MRIGEQIKNYRKTAGLTQEQVANYLGVSTPEYYGDFYTTCPE